MTTLAEHIIVVGAENRPLILEKTMYDSWASHIRLFIKGKKNGSMMLDSIDKVSKEFYTTNYDQLYAYLSQHERHANEVHVMRERYLDPLALQGEDSIDYINKAMAFLSAVASRFPPSNNQLRTSSNPRNQATIQDGRVTVQQVQGRQIQSFAGTGNKRIATNSKGNYAEGQARVVKCYNYQRERHMARQCTQPKRPRIYAWFKEKMSLTKDLDTYDSDCYDISLAKAVLMANLSSCDSDVLSEVPYSDTYLNDMNNQDVQEMSYSKQTHIVDFLDNEITSDSNINPYSQYLQELQDAGIHDTNSSTPNDLLVLSLVEQMTDHVANLDKENQTNKMVNESLTVELEGYKE
ncbi:hypothetical protein Tco_1082826 [Tanacetum coccineum]|uniref:Integrase, catalytic region, zinc finger, CCHC-type, peptidase aspartic, catalytic n=1 Tax=Tanacetum coccineum TaxID=301880 RepID=A0ABQ5I1G6_9ASTR